MPVSTPSLLILPIDHSLTPSRNRRQGKGTQCANLVNDFAFCHLSGMLCPPSSCRVLSLSPPSLSYILPPTATCFAIKPQPATFSARSNTGRAPNMVR